MGEVCEIEFGTRITKNKDEVKEDVIEKYPVYGGGDITFYTSKYNRENDILIISRFGVSPNCVRCVEGKLWLNDSGMSIKKYKNINKNYLNNYLLNYQDIIFTYSSGGGQKNMETNKLLRELIIPVPSPEDQGKVVKMIEEIEKKESDYNKSIESIKKLVETIYTNIEMKCSSITSNVVETDEDNTSKSTTSSKSVKTYKINGIKCIKENDNYYDFTNNEKGNLIATTNKKGEVELVDEEEEEKEGYELITIGKKDYILIDENVYTIANDEPDELYGKYVNSKFTKFNNDKIIVKGRKQKTDEELEAELGM